MNYAIKYYIGCRTLPKADEIIIKYTHETDELIKFAQEEINENQRLVVDLNEFNTEEKLSDSLKIFIAAMEVHKNFALKTTIEDKNIVDYAESNIPFFVMETVDCWDELTHQIGLGVSDVYIVNEFGFYLPKISQYCHDMGVKVRAYPNVAQSRTSAPNINSFTKFFIRPEDIFIYEEMIDTFEFFGPLDKQPVLYDIYSQERWLGKLNEIILGLDNEIDNMTIAPYFGESRRACEKRCAYGRCNVCNSIASLAAVLESKNIKMKKKAIRHEQRNILNESAETFEKTKT